jgi:chemotaxis protein MotA
MFYEVAGRYAPGFGMCGTLIGMIIMMQNLSDPKQIGTAMSLAMVATLYGALGANFFFLPMADKLTNLHKDEAMVRHIVIEGIVSIQTGDNPRIVEDKLRTFLKKKAPAKA